MKQKYWLIFTGLMWSIIGGALLGKGIQLLQAHTPQHTTVMWYAVAALIGYMKGRFVFSKTTTRITKHILSLSEPVSLKSVYPPAYWAVIGSMFFLSFLFRYLPPDIRGFADFAIGVALIYGSTLYLRNANLLKT